jgi:hypothetical protein
MRNKLFLILLLLAFVAISLVTTGCEKDGKIRIVNRTSYPLYASVQGDNMTIAGGEARSVEVTTRTQSPLTDEVSKYVKVDLQGETFQIYDEFLQRFVDSTYVLVKAGKTTSIYAQPNRACIKVVNHSGQHISQIITHRHTEQNTITDFYNVDLPNNASWFKQEPPATTSNSFYFTVDVVFDDSTILTFGGPDSRFAVDEEFLIDVVPLDVK